MTRYGRDAVLGRSVYETDILAGAQVCEEALAKLVAEKPIPHREAFLHLPSGATPVIVAGRPIEMGDVACMLFTFADIKPRRKADTVGRTLAETSLRADDHARRRFDAGLAGDGSVPGIEACLVHGTGGRFDCPVSAERVTITGEAAVLQDITERKRFERELFEAIEAVRADASWFTRGLVERLSGLRHPG